MPESNLSTSPAAGSSAQGNYVPPPPQPSNAFGRLAIDDDMPAQPPAASPASDELIVPLADEPDMYHLDLRTHSCRVAVLDAMANADGIGEHPMADAENVKNADGEQPRSNSLPSTPVAKGFLKNVRGLLATGLLEGLSVTYKNNGVEMAGRIHQQGYLWGCPVCNYSKVLSACKFEKHSGESSNNQNDHIFLDSGITLYGAVQELKGTSLHLLGDVIEEKIGLPPNLKQFEEWKSSLQADNDELDVVTYDPYSIQRWINFPPSGLDIMNGFEEPTVERVNNEADKQPRNNGLSTTIPVKGQGTATKFNPESVLKDVRGLLATGLLEGFRVTYKKNVVELSGIIDQQGYRCGCLRCNYSKVLSACEFENHSGESSKNQNGHIFLDSGISLYKVVQALKGTRLDLLGDVIEENIGLSPNQKQFEVWKASFHLDNDDSDVADYDPCSIKRIISSHESIVGETSPPSATSLASEHSLNVDWRAFTKRRSDRHFKRGNSNSTPTLSMSSEKAMANTYLGAFIETSTEKNHSENIGDPLVANGEIPIRHPGPATAISIVSIPDLTASPAFAASLPATVIQDPPIDHNICPKSKGSSEGKLRDGSLHQLIFKESGLPDGTLLTYKSKGEVLITGHKRGTSIVCTCHSKKFSPSKFENHAGKGKKRQPYRSIYTPEGLTLHELSVKLRQDLKLNASGSVTSSAIDEQPKPNHSGFGRQSSTAVRSPIVPLKRTLQERVIKTESCYLCGNGHTTVGTISPDTIVFCNQCERPCHVKCYNKTNEPKKGPVEVLVEYAQFRFLCCLKCQLLRASLIQRLENHEEQSFTGESGSANAEGVNWHIFSGRDTRSNVRRFIPQVIEMLKDAFAETAAQDNDIIPNMVNAEDVSGEKDFRGMYCAVVAARRFVVSAAILKVRTEEIAELVLIATRSQCQKKGYCRFLLGKIEAQLRAWRVQLLAAPVDPEMGSIWSEKLGFSISSEEQKRSLLEAHPMVMFENLNLAHKSLA